VGIENPIAARLGHRSDEKWTSALKDDLCATIRLTKDHPADDWRLASSSSDSRGLTDWFSLSWTWFGLRQLIFGTFILAILIAAVPRVAPSQVHAAVEASPALATPPGLASGVSEVMKMFKGGVPADIIAGYVNNSTLSFYLSADNILSLQQQGVPAPVIMAMIQRYGELQRQTGMAARVPVQVPAAAPAPPYYSYAPEEPASS
jgi:hypothetical protein